MFYYGRHHSQAFAFGTSRKLLMLKRLPRLRNLYHCPFYFLLILYQFVRNYMVHNSHVYRVPHMYLLTMAKYNFHLLQICPPVVLFIIFSLAMKQLLVSHRNHDDLTSIKNWLHAINHKNRSILTIYTNLQ